MNLPVMNLPVMKDRMSPERLQLQDWSKEHQRKLSIVGAGIVTFDDDDTESTAIRTKTEDIDILIRNIEIDRTVQEAKDRILSIEGDADEGWPAYEEKTLDHAAAFLYQLDNRETAKVRVLPASGGSIDLHWKKDEFELLINFSPDGSVDYYGDDYKGNLIQGNTSKPQLIACWMKHINE